MSLLASLWRQQGTPGECRALPRTRGLAALQSWRPCCWLERFSSSHATLAAAGRLVGSRLAIKEWVCGCLVCVCAEGPPFEPAIPGQFSLLRALVSGLIPDTWESDFYERQLDARSRLRLSQASKGCQAWVWGAADRATVTLRANSATSAAACATQQARAEQRLAQRAGRSNAVMLQMSSFSDAAVQSLLSLAPAAGSAVTELSVQLPECAWFYNGRGPLHTPWVSQLPAAFSNLRTLRINCVRGCLPTPSLLPNLRELHLTAKPVYGDESLAQCTGSAMYASISPYLQQIHTLGINGIIWWEEVITTVTRTLRVLESDDHLTDVLVGLLCKQTPKLERLACGGFCFEDFTGEHAQSEWSVREFKKSSYDAEQLAVLPRSPGGVLRLLADGGEHISIDFRIAEPEGLSTAVLQRLEQWQYAAPCEATLTRYQMPDDWPEEYRHPSLKAALRQLSVLPAGSFIEVCDHTQGIHEVAEAVAATAPGLAHITAVSPFVLGTSGDVSALMQHAQVFRHANVGCGDAAVFGGGDVSHEAFPWEHLRLYGDRRGVALKTLLQLPDPVRGGKQHEISLHALDFSDTHKLTHEELCKLKMRLAHWTFVVRGNIRLHLHCPYSTSAANEPAILRTQLQLLHDFRWRFEPGADVHVVLCDWLVSYKFMRELQGLPVLPAGMCLRLHKCWWGAASGGPCGARVGFDCIDLVGFIPTSYNTLWLESGCGCDYKPEHVVNVCRGAKARGWGVDKLTLKCLADSTLTQQEQSRIEACIEEHGLGGYVAEIQWTEKREGYTEPEIWHRTGCVINSGPTHNPEEEGCEYDGYEHHRSPEDSYLRSYAHHQSDSDEFEYLYAQYLAGLYHSPEPSESESEPRSEDRYERRYARMSPTWSDEGSFQSDD